MTADLSETPIDWTPSLADKIRWWSGNPLVLTTTVVSILFAAAVTTALIVLGVIENRRTNVESAHLSGTTLPLTASEVGAGFTLASGNPVTSTAGPRSGSRGTGTADAESVPAQRDATQTDLLAGLGDGITLLASAGDSTAEERGKTPPSAVPVDPTGLASLAGGWRVSSATSGTARNATGTARNGVSSPGARGGSGGGGSPRGRGPQGSPATFAPPSALPAVAASGAPATPPAATAPADTVTSPPVVIASAPPTVSTPASTPGGPGPSAAAPGSTPGPGSASPQTPPPIIIATGPVEGFGPIDAPVSVVPGGVLAPGASPGELTLNDDFRLFGGILEIDIWGPIPGDEHDLMTILGEAIFDSGAIQFVFTNDDTGAVFMPSEGDTFTFLTAAGGISGFDNNANLALFSLDLAASLDFIVNNDGNALTLEIIAATEPRDLLTHLDGPVFEVNDGSIDALLAVNAVGAPGVLALHLMGVLLLLAGAAVRRRRAGSGGIA